MSAKTSTRVTIYDQSYAIGGSDGDYIQQLADRVDAKMRQVARETHVVDTVRVAVLAAINLADENDALRRRLEQQEHDCSARARALAADLDQVLGRVG